MYRLSPPYPLDLYQSVHQRGRRESSHNKCIDQHETKIPENKGRKGAEQKSEKGVAGVSSLPLPFVFINCNVTCVKFVKVQISYLR